MDAVSPEVMTLPTRDQPLRRIQIEPSSTRWLLGAVTFLLMVMAAGYFQWVKLREAGVWVFHTRQVILGLEHFLSDFRSAESAQRGYLLVGELQYLAPYQAGRQSVLEELHRLELLVAENPAQKARMTRLHAVVDQKLAELDQGIDLQMVQSREAAIQLVETDRGRMLMQEVERQLDEIREAESRVLEKRIALEQTSSNAAAALLLVGGVVLLVLLVAASIRINSQIQHQRALLADAAGQMTELARSNEELQRFAFVASHDLQEPLRIISSYSALLTRRYQGKLDAQGDEFLHYIVTHVDRMQALIRDLLDYSRAGRRTEHFTRVAADTVLRHALENLQVSVSESGAEIVADPLPEVTANPAQLIPIFQNLIGNAIKFRAERPVKIHISARESGKFWIFCVADNGVGIDPQHKDRIFGLFQRLDTSRPGTGIGLAICRKTIESYGGRIWVESVLGQGSQFYFTLPA